MTATDQSVHLATIAARAAADKLATNLVAFDVSEKLAITDIFLVATAANDRQVGAVVEAIEEALHRQNVKRTRIEGDREQRWVLVDFLDLVVHVMQPEERSLYSLERLWADCPRIALDVEETR
ncbi:ribosome silencing factor [Raineyella fluvialis]|uniref:Ribosomal silencing factor RsfS n=1 Tax=Raineyella fluvialis TaxID=2662261 RepID=A0A5Q2FBL5_9ACTN|nr:ribosome silencing factor [Raineyella fluvialis]QGF24272.1 ribosome silencing factor [Raineyella fluvialis]